MGVWGEQESCEMRGEIMFEFEVRVDGWDFGYRCVAKTAGKAKYAYYQFLQDGIWETTFAEIMPRLLVKKIGRATIQSFFGNPETFASVREQRNMPFVHQGMRLEVDGKMGTVVGANSSSNWSVVFDGTYHEEYCHPWWKTRYFDADGNVIADYREV